VAAALQRVAEAGADLVVGHHPHVPQGIQVHRGVPICYSLGNFVFYQETELLYRKRGYLVRVGVARHAVSQLEIIPYRIEADRLSLLEGDGRDRFLNDLERVSRPLADNDGVRDAWHGFLRHYGTDGFRREIAMLLDRLAQTPPKGAAMFRNRITTMQHREHWIDAMTRIMDGTLNDSPQWAYDLTAEYLTRPR
jgi:poly-gamma-glutamate synthesis protein (capsule biosynthesis protein)